MRASTLVQILNNNLRSFGDFEVVVEQFIPDDGEPSLELVSHVHIISSSDDFNPNKEPVYFIGAN